LGYACQELYRFVGAFLVSFCVVSHLERRRLIV
jgi:hypothetical protein